VSVGAVRDQIGKNTMLSRHSRACRIACLALVIAAGPVSAEESRNLCAGLPEAQRGPCQQAFDLITQEQDLPLPDLTVLVRGTGQTWRYEYRLAANAGASQGDVTCVPEGALTLPQGKTVQLLFTADDDIYEWRLPALGLNATAIPGRIEDVRLEASATGTFSGSPAGGSEELTPLIEVLDAGSFDAWREGTLLKSCDGG
jgi:heme/copper-type cytochrome/quinol oxidase subunit 2